MYQRRMCMSALVLALAFATGASAQVGQGKVLAEYWFGGGIDAVMANFKANANFASPADSEWLNGFDRPDVAAWDNWGARLRGYVTPPQTGDYTFWTSSDDDSEVWLSTDDNPANAALVCSVTGWGNYQDWTGTSGSMGPNFKSAPIKLEAGKRYYMETLMCDGTGGGLVCVAWAGPGIGDAPTVLGGDYVSAFIRDPEPMFCAQKPNPASGSPDIVAPLFQWTPGINALMDDVYFGTTPELGAAQLMGKQPSAIGLFFYPLPLEPGATYYWRIDTTDTSNVLHVGAVWTFTVMPAKATVPDPANGAKGQPVSLALSWKAGQNMPTHDLYLGTDKAAVEAGDASVFKGNLADATFQADGLAFDTTYYWRVDEIDMMTTKFVGDVWEFKTTLEVLGKITRQIWENIGSGTAVTDLTNNVNFPLKPTRTEIATSFRTPDLGISNYGGRMSAWLHVPTDGDYTFWIASDDSSELWFGTTPGDAKLIASVSGYSNVDQWTKFPSQQSAVQTLKAGVYFIDALWKEGGGGDHCSVAWQGPDIPQQVIPGGFCELFTGYWAQKASPANNATGVVQTPTLSWAPGVKAAKHDVYFGDTFKGVNEATPKSSQFKSSLEAGVLTFSPGTLVWNKTYYWRVDEVNEAEKGSPWKGAVWTFRVADYLIINNAQQTLYYNNAESPFFTELACDTPANWSANATEALSLEFQGAAAVPVVTGTTTPVSGSTTVDAPGAYTLSGSGTDIWGTADQFQFAYMKLTGDGSIVAKVESVENKNVWAKGGVMIRQSVNANSTYAIMAMTGGGAGTGGGVNFQWRATAGASAAAGPNGPGVNCPGWVKLDRVGNVFTAFYSADGAAWTQLGDPQTIEMADPVLIGLAYTSHVNASTFGTGKFTNVATTGNVDAASANNLDVGLGNTPQPIYVAVQDAAGKVAIATYPQENASTIPSWTMWKVKLSDLAGVDLANVAKLFVGVGNSLNPAKDGLGRINVRNIRVVKAVSLGSPISKVVRAGGTTGDRSPCGAFAADTAPLATQSGGLRNGNTVYSDRDYPWNNIPAEMVGAAYVRIFNTDKGTSATAPGTYTVTLSRAAKLMICHDDRNTPAQDLVDKIAAAFVPSGTFKDTGVDVFIYESASTPARPLSVFAAELPAGDYVLAMQASGNTHYIIAAMDTAAVDVTNSTDNVLGLPANNNWPAAEFPRNVVDNSNNKFLHFSGATEPTGFEVQPFVGSTIVTGLTFQSANDAPERDPVKFELFGSNDSITGPWTAIAAGDIVDFAGATAYARNTKGTTPITFENTTAYKFYQVMFPACRGPKQNSMQIGEVELLGSIAR